MATLTFDHAVLMHLEARILPVGSEQPQITREKRFEILEVEGKTVRIKHVETLGFKPESMLKLETEWIATFNASEELTVDQVNEMVSQDDDILYPVWVKSAFTLATVTEQMVSIPIMVNPNYQGDNHVSAAPKKRRTSKAK